MRLPRESLLLLLLLTVVSLLVGVLIGVGTGTWALPHPATPPTRRTPTPTPTPTPIPPDTQRSLLLIGANSEDRARGRLDVCWVISYVPEDHSKYYAFNFPPTTPIRLMSLPDKQTLDEVYAADLQQQRGMIFTQDAVQSLLDDLSVQAVLVLSRPDLARLVDKLGGLQLDSQAVTGETLFSTYDAWSPDHMEDRLHFQEQVLQAIFRQLDEQRWSPQALAGYFRDNPALYVEGLDAFTAEAPPFLDAQLIWVRYGESLAEDAATP